MHFYFESILQYEIQQFMEKVQKIPFIRDGPTFRAFFEVQEQRGEVTEKDIDSINDNSFAAMVGLGGAGQYAAGNQATRGSRIPSS